MIKLVTLQKKILVIEIPSIHSLQVAYLFDTIAKEQACQMQERYILPGHLLSEMKAIKQHVVNTFVTIFVNAYLTSKTLLGHFWVL